MLGVAPLCLAYAIYSRSFEDFILFGGRVVVFFSSLIALWALLLPIRLAFEAGAKPRRPPIKLLAVVVVGGVVLSIPVGILYYSFGVVLSDAWTNLREWDSLIEQRPFALGTGTLLVLTIALVLFWIRLRVRFIYGASEALVGMAVAMHRLDSEQTLVTSFDMSFYFVILTASVYLIVRGFDNMHQGWRDQIDPVAKLLFRLGTQSELVSPTPRRLKPMRIRRMKLVLRNRRY